MTVTEFNNLIADSGAFSPLFNDLPDGNKAVHEAVTGVITTEQFGGSEWKVFRLLADGIPTQASMGVVRGAENKTTWNIGKFTCIREHKSKSGKTKFEANITFRYFAY